MQTKYRFIIGIVGIFILSNGAAFFAGAKHERQRSDLELASLREAHQKAVIAAEEEASENLRKKTAAVNAAISERDKALASASRLRADASGLRLKLEARSGSGSGGASGAGAGVDSSGRLARCEKLLGEGAELVGEGAELSERIAASKSVLIAAQKSSQ